jgi:hypothetical protein
MEMREVVLDVVDRPIVLPPLPEMKMYGLFSRELCLEMSHS